MCTSACSGEGLIMISNQTQENEARKFTQSLAASGISGVVVLNPDGSNVGSGLTATDFDIRNLLFATDKVDTSGSNLETGLRPPGTVLTTYSAHLTSNDTTTIISSTVYISSITINTVIAGTTSTITVQDKQGTPLKLVNEFVTTALPTIPQILNFQTPVKMTSGIDIITAGGGAATVDIWVNYYL